MLTIGVTNDPLHNYQPERRPVAKKSEWTGACCETDRDKEAIRSWFCGLDKGLVGPSKARLLTRIEDDHVLKLAALFVDERGAEKELIRSNGRNFTISIRRPTAAIWR